MDKIYLRPNLNSNLAGTSAYIKDEQYHDAYLAYLDEFYIIEDVFGTYCGEIVGGIESRLEEFIKNIPGSFNGGEAFINILEESALEQRWQPDIVCFSTLNELDGVKSTREALDYIRGERWMERTDEGYLEDVKEAYAHGFLIPSTYQGSLIVLPSQTCVEHWAVCARGAH